MSLTLGARCTIITTCGSTYNTLTRQIQRINDKDETNENVNDVALWQNTTRSKDWRKFQIWKKCSERERASRSAASTPQAAHTIVSEKCIKWNWMCDKIHFIEFDCNGNDNCVRLFTNNSQSGRGLKSKEMRICQECTIKHLFCDKSFFFLRFAKFVFHNSLQECSTGIYRINRITPVIVKKTIFLSFSLFVRIEFIVESTMWLRWTFAILRIRFCRQKNEKLKIDWFERMNVDCEDCHNKDTKGLFVCSR